MPGISRGSSDIPQKRSDKRHQSPSTRTRKRSTPCWPTPTWTDGRGGRPRPVRPRRPDRPPVSELTGLTGADVQLGTGAHVHCPGKGRKQRCTPITKSTAALLRAWLRERGGVADEPCSPPARDAASPMMQSDPRSRQLRGHPAALPVTRKQRADASCSPAHLAMNLLPEGCSTPPSSPCGSDTTDSPAPPTASTSTKTCPSNRISARP